MTLCSYNLLASSFTIMLLVAVSTASTVTPMMSISWLKERPKIGSESAISISHFFQQQRQKKKKKSAASHFDRMVDRVFEKADVNKDGRITFSECYALVMKLYVYLNRQAPVPPPTRTSLRCLFQACDVNGSNCISKEEFTELAHVLGKRAFLRVVACKIVKIAGAPLLAEYTMRSLEGRTWPLFVAKSVVPKPFRPKVLPVITSPAFGRTILIVAFVTTLGNVVVGGVNLVLQQSLPGEEESYL